ncbi:hypothetical protein [Pseudomonas grandcourensis]|uniref:hypothetical protein n=1 Tax=Pseudomonas grandcourensis TaxID=3136736 RepID=UPI003267C6F4
MPNENTAETFTVSYGKMQCTTKMRPEFLSTDLAIYTLIPDNFDVQFSMNKGVDDAQRSITFSFDPNLTSGTYLLDNSGLFYSAAYEESGRLDRQPRANHYKATAGSITITVTNEGTDRHYDITDFTITATSTLTGITRVLKGQFDFVREAAAVIS